MSTETLAKSEMKQILVVTHGELAFELIKTVEFVLGEKPAIVIKGVSFSPEGGFDALAGKIKTHLSEAEGGTVILTDMFGGTPSNVSLTFLEPGRVEVVTGVNLPMLLKLAAMKPGASLPGAVSAAKRAGRENVVSASEILTGGKASSRQVGGEEESK